MITNRLLSSQWALFIACSMLVIGVLRRCVVGALRFYNLCGSHLQGQVIVLVT